MGLTFFKSPVILAHIMEYIQLLKKSWQATWRQKMMWWLGMAVLGGGSSVFFRLSVDVADIALDDSSGDPSPLVEVLNDPLAQLWWQDYWWLVVVVIVALLLLWLMAIVFHLIARSGLYFGAQQARLEQSVRFSEMLHAGVQSFWRYIGFYLLFGVGKLAAQIAIIMNLLLLSATIIGLIVAVPLVVILLLLSFPLAMALEVFVIYSLQGMSLQQYSSAQTMQEAWQKLQRRPGQTALAYVLMIIVKLVVGLGGLLIALLIATPFAIFVYVAYTSQAPLLAVVSGCVGLFVLMVIGLIGKGIFISFQSHFWNRVYTLPLESGRDSSAVEQ